MALVPRQLCILRSDGNHFGIPRDLSAPYLTDVSLQMHNEDFDDPVPDWFIAIFNRGAPLLRTMHLRGMALSNCQFPPTEIVELKLDVRENFFVFILPKVFTYMPKLRALDIRGSFLWSEEDMRGDPVVLPVLERLTWGWLCIKPLLVSILTPTLQYLCLTKSVPDDVYLEPPDRLQDLVDAITGSPYLPILPNLDELRYDIELNYAADCIFVGLPRVSLVQFSLEYNGHNGELYSNFFKTLMDDPLRWPHLTTIIFKSLPDQLFNPLRDLVLARSSEDHRFTICIEYTSITCYSAGGYHTYVLSAEHMMWLRQHVNVEMVPGIWRA